MLRQCRGEEWSGGCVAGDRVLGVSEVGAREVGRSVEGRDSGDWVRQSP